MKTNEDKKDEKHPRTVCGVSRDTNRSASTRGETKEYRISHRLARQSSEVCRLQLVDRCSVVFLSLLANALTLAHNMVPMHLNGNTN